MAMVVISETRQEQIAKMPIIETRIFKSKEGGHIVHRTVITDIKPVKYYSKVLEGRAEPVPEEDLAEEA